MTYTLTDYQRAVDTFLDDIRPLGPDLISVLLFGSLARGDVKPGKSDLLDAYLVMRSQVQWERTRFLNALQLLVNAAVHLRQTGLPTHPFFYCFEHELDRSPAMWLSLWRSDETSAVLCGNDVRPLLTNREESSAVARMSVFQMRQLAHELSFYLSQESLSEEECAEIIEQISTLKKFFPIMACLVLDHWITESHGREEIEKVLPGVDASVLSRSMSFRSCPPPCSDVESWRTLIVDFLRFVEQVHVALLKDALYERSPVFSSLFQTI